jgi:septum formation protein
LLSEAGYQFQVRPSDIDENFAGHDLSPSDFARTLARAKAWAVLPNYPDSVILAADTIVCLGERILGKPADENDAYRMLSLLAATTHIVITGVAVVRRHPEISNIERVMSAVRMRDLSHAELHRYIAGGQWQGKAGGYGIQDPDPFVVRIAGCQTNIVGLPMTTTRRLLASTGVFPPSQSSPVLS